jgi:hypothetical protein
MKAILTQQTELLKSGAKIQQKNEATKKVTSQTPLKMIFFSIVR